MCWCTESCSKMSFGKLTLLLWKNLVPFYIALYANMAVSSRDCKPRIDGFHVTSSPPCWWTKTKDKERKGTLFKCLVVLALKH